MVAVRGLCCSVIILISLRGVKIVVEMSVENPLDDKVEGSKSTNGTSSDHVNGLQNGYSNTDKHKSSHKSSNKDKYREKDREHKNGSSKYSSSSGRDKDKHSNKDHRSSHKSSSRDKEKGDKDKRDKDKERSDKNRDRSDKDKEKSEKSRERSDKDKGKHDKERSDKEKDRSGRDKHHDKEKGKSEKGEGDVNRKDREKPDKAHDKLKNVDKDKKSPSSKDHRTSSSSRDHKSSKSSHDKHRHDKDKYHHSSYSSKEKNHSSSSSSKDRSEGKEKSTPDDAKQSLQSDKSAKIKMDNLLIEEELHSKTKESSVKKEEDSWDASIPNGDQLNSTASSCDYSLSQFKDEPVDKIKMEVESEEDLPLSARIDKKRKAPPVSESDEEKPLSARKQNKVKKIKIKKESDYDDEDAYSDENSHKAKKKKKKPQIAVSKSNDVSPVKRKKKQDESEEVWKWWEEEKKQDGTKWTYLEHKGPLFAPEYERVPKEVVFRYDNKVMILSEETEEVAGFYAKMLDHDYTTKKIFNNNFFQDWRKVMSSEEQRTIKELSKCDFKSMHAYFTAQAEKNRNRSKEEKAALKAKNEEIQKEYGFCIIDGHKEKIGNFRIEPPGLFRGRGEHPKMGMLKKRVVPEHVLINCSKDSTIPKAPGGRKWKEVRHDNTVTWLASWTENVQGQVKYVMLNPSSKLKGEKDWQKYEIARKLHKSINKIRETYRDEWKAKEMRVRQRAVALYFIDKLALRAGNEKDEEQADTVGCCSLRVEHIELHTELNGKKYVVVFDFLGKDSIRYYNEVEVEKRVFKNLELFKENKKGSDDLFDRLNTQILNEHLRDLMPGLTAKVFRTYNASITLQNQLDELTDADYSIAEKILAYNRANRAVAILCNHQRAVPKGHEKSMQALKEKIALKNEQIDEAEADLKDVLKLAKKGSVKEKLNADKKKKALEKLRDQLKKLEVQETDRDENKSIALGTSKLNYLDPRISVAWCKKYDVPLERIYNKTQRDKFRWAIDMADADYIF